MSAYPTRAGSAALAYSPSATIFNVLGVRRARWADFALDLFR